MFVNQHVIWGSIILTACLVSTIVEVRRGSIASLRKEIARSVGVGVFTERLHDIINQERGSEALISLFISAYALPFLIRTPDDAILPPLSVVSRAYGLATFLHDSIDLRVEGDEEDDAERLVRAFWTLEMVNVTDDSHSYCSSGDDEGSSAAA
eukprot:UN3584